MIAILTDKPSVGKEIGRIIGATRVRNGYVEEEKKSEESSVQPK